MAPPPRRPNRWLVAAMRPLHMAVGAVGPLLAAVDPHLAWAIPVSAAVWATLTAREVRESGARAAPADPLALAGPEIPWAETLAALRSLPARTLLQRVERAERRITALAREAAPGTREVLAVALAEVREAARGGADVARALDRLGAQLAEVSPLRERFGAVALHLRAMAHADREAADALYGAAERRMAYAGRAAAMAALYDRLGAEGARLVAELDHAALDAAALAARGTATARVRVDAAVAREALAEYETLEAELAGATAPRGARSGS